MSQFSHATLTSNPDVNLQEESFLDALPTEERLKKVRIIVVNVPCSKSGIVNPVDFVLQEGVTSSIKELARGNIDTSKVKGLAFQHLSFLRHAMKFPQAQAIIYITRSTHNSENMDVVKKAMEMNQEERSKQTSFYELTPALPKLAQSLKEAARISNGLLQSEISLTHKGKLVINVQLLLTGFHILLIVLVGRICLQIKTILSDHFLNSPHLYTSVYIDSIRRT